jgi:DNA-binding LacI/PurR family transcriptional regulator
MNGSKQAGMAIKTIVVLLVGLTLASVRLAEAQQPKKVPRIGFLSGGSASTAVARTEAFSQGLRELGYEEGKSIVIERRYAEGKPDRLPALAAELVRPERSELPTSWFVALNMLRK